MPKTNLRDRPPFVDTIVRLRPNAATRLPFAVSVTAQITPPLFTVTHQSQFVNRGFYDRGAVWFG